jgi:hypothetical protein
VADHLSRMNRGQDDKEPICSIKTLG